MTIILGPANATPSRQKCTRCRKPFTWPGFGPHQCAKCIRSADSRNQANSAPDYVELATVAVETFTGHPRKTWPAQSPEHWAVTELLERWAELRRAA